MSIGSLSLRHWGFLQIGIQIVLILCEIKDEPLRIGVTSLFVPFSDTLPLPTLIVANAILSDRVKLEIHII